MNHLNFNFFFSISTDQRTSMKSNVKRPSSVSWMVTNPRGHFSRMGTPTVGYLLDSCAISSSAVAAAASLVATSTASSGAQQVRQMSDEFAADPSKKLISFLVVRIYHIYYGLVAHPNVILSIQLFLLLYTVNIVLFENLFLSRT